MDLGTLRSICDHINQSWRSSQVQKIWTTDQALVLELYHQQSFWMVVETFQGGQLWMFDHRPDKYKTKKVTPLGLFLQAHLEGLYLRDAQVQIQYGRVLQIHFENKYKQTKLDIVCVPGALNIMAQTQDDKGVKKISLHRPVELPQIQWEHVDRRVEYDWLSESAKSLQQNPKKVSSSDSKPIVDESQKLIQKKNRALIAIQEKNQQIQELQTHLRDLAHRLSSGESLESVESTHLDPHLNLWQNIQSLYEKSKALEGKLQGGKQRLEQLQAEIEKLEKQPAKISSPSPSGSSNLGIKKSAAVRLQLRKMELSDGLVAYFGKNAKDNLQLLRQAKPWYLWVHLKDYPSCYGIIHSMKNQKVPASEIEKVSFWILQDFYKNKAMMPSKLDVVVCECRHVHPLKGDQVGRVTYHHPENFSFTFRSKN